MKSIYFIHENVPSLKNSKVKTSKGIFHSAAVRKYLQKIGVKNYSARDKKVEEYKKRPNLFRAATKGMKEYILTLEYPIVFGLYFVRDSRRKFDFNNANQLIFDLLQAHDIVDEDNMDHCLPVPMAFNDVFYEVQPIMPGVYIKVLGKKALCEFWRDLRIKEDLK